MRGEGHVVVPSSGHCSSAVPETSTPVVSSAASC